MIALPCASSTGLQPTISFSDFSRILLRLFFFVPNPDSLPTPFSLAWPPSRASLSQPIIKLSVSHFLFLSSTDTQINQALINSLQASQIYHHHHYALRDHDHHHHQLANTGWILGSFFTLSETTRGKTGGMNWVNFKSPRAFLNIIIINISVLLKINIKVFLIEVTINNKSVGGAIVDEREFKSFDRTDISCTSTSNRSGSSHRR